VGVHHDDGDGARACDDGDGKGDDEGLFFGGFDIAVATGREDHGEGDEEEENPASDADDGAANAEELEDGVSKEGEEE